MFIKSLLAGLAGAGRRNHHDLGTTEVPGAPQRIVVLEYSFVDTLAAVGATPVGIAGDEMRDSTVPIYTTVIGDKWASFGTRKSPSLEVLVSLQPDLNSADAGPREAV